MLRARGQGGLLQNIVSAWDRAIALRNSRQLWLPTQKQVSQTSIVDGEESYEDPSLTEELLAVADYEGESVLFGGV